MSFEISELITLLQRHNAEKVLFYPYSTTTTYSVECYLIVEPFNYNNLEDVQNVNIKLFSTEIIDTLNIKLENPYKIEFLDGVKFYFNKIIAIPISTNILNITTKQKAKIADAELININNYYNFEYNILKCDVIPLQDFKISQYAGSLFVEPKPPITGISQYAGSEFI